VAKPILNPRVKQFLIARVEIGPIGIATERPIKIDLRKSRNMFLKKII